MFAQHPDHGYVGNIQYEKHPDHIEIHNLMVWPQHKRRGVASQLMSELERRNPDTVIDHGMRSPAGTQWAKDFYGHEGDPHPHGPGWTQAPKTRDSSWSRPRLTRSDWSTGGGVRTSPCPRTGP